MSLGKQVPELNPLVLDRGRGVGGRCATRRVEDGIPVDHGVPMIHGRSPELRQLLDALKEPQPLWDWPMRVRGEGTPCQPQAYDSRTWRAAFAPGVRAFAKHLAVGQNIRHRIELHRLPPYSPEFNPMEGVWKATKKMTTHNCFHKTVEARDSALRQTFSRFRREPSLIAGHVARFQ